MVRLLLLFTHSTQKYNENGKFELSDWDTFLKLMKNELIDKEIEEEPRAKCIFAHKLLSDMLKGINHHNS